MKKIPIVLFAICLLTGTTNNDAWAQFWSTQAIFSPGSSTLISDASRFHYHRHNHSTYYMRYVDSSYFCNTVYYTVATTPMSTKISMDQDFVISDFKKFLYYQGFIGSYQGVGMYGRAISYDAPINTIEYYKLPTVERLNRIAVIPSSVYNNQLKAYAIGQRPTSKGPKQSCILEFYAEGVGAVWPYYYAPLAFDPATNTQEIADDVITLDNYVIFATRDTRRGHAPVNLRISDTTDVLQNSDIDAQWRFMLPDYQILCSELRLQNLLDGFFVLTYTIFDTQEEKYYLCVQRIHLYDFLAENNTILHYDIPISERTKTMVDIVYEPDVDILVILLKGNKMSRIYHTYPNSVYSSTVSVLDYPNANASSIDTIGDYAPSNVDIYVVLGDTNFFSQDISYGLPIDNSCLNKDEDKTIPQENYIIKREMDPINRYASNKIINSFVKPSSYIEGSAPCVIIGVKK